MEWLEHHRLVLIAKVKKLPLITQLFCLQPLLKVVIMAHNSSNSLQCSNVVVMCTTCHKSEQILNKSNSNLLRMLTKELDQVQCLIYMQVGPVDPPWFLSVVVRNLPIITAHRRQMLVRDFWHLRVAQYLKNNLTRTVMRR